MRNFSFVISLALILFATSAASQVGQVGSDGEQVTTVIHGELSQEQHKEITQFMAAVWAIGEAGRSFDDDIDYIDSINLWFDDYDSSNVPWWQVFGTLLFVSDVSNNLLNEEYGKALAKIGEYVTMDLLNSKLTTGQLLEFQSYSSLATLAVSLPLEAFVELVDTTGFHNQMEAYRSARLDIGLTHEQISKAQSDLGVKGKHGYVYFSDEGWITAISYDDDVGGEWAGLRRTISPIAVAPVSALSNEKASERTYDLIRMFLNAPNYGRLSSEDAKRYVLAMQEEIDRRRALESASTDTSQPEAASLVGGYAGGGAGGGGGGSIESAEEDFANSLFVSAVKQALAAATLDESERKQVYEGVAETFNQIVSDFPNTRQAAAILSESVPGIDFSLLNSENGSDAASILSENFQEGLYTIDPALCGLEGAVGDAWGTLFQSISRTAVRRGIERDCNVLAIESDGDALSISAECLVEGVKESERWVWRKTSDVSFVETEGRYDGKTYARCLSDSASQRLPSTETDQIHAEVSVIETANTDGIFVQTHSRKDFDEAYKVAQELSRNGAPQVNVFASANGWFAVTAVRVPESDATDARLQSIIANYDLPQDSIFTQGDRFIELRASFEGHATRPTATQDRNLPKMTEPARPESVDVILRANPAAQPDQSLSNNFQECQSIASEEARLLCYDSKAESRISPVENSNAEVAFSKLKYLVEYSRTGVDDKSDARAIWRTVASSFMLLRETIRFSECNLVAETHWIGRGGHPKAQGFARIIPLQSVDIEKTNGLRSEEIVLKRGATFTKIYGRRSSWRVPDDLIIVRSFGPNGFQLATDLQGIDIEELRSGFFKLGYAHEEDTKEITDAFTELAVTCGAL